MAYARRPAKLPKEFPPLSDDVVTGVDAMLDLASICTLDGENVSTIDLLDQLLAIPSDLSVDSLLQNPERGPLRDHPHFEVLTDMNRKEHGVWR